MDTNMKDAAEYLLTSKNKTKTVWALGANLHRFQEFESKYGNNFYLVIRCDHGTVTEKVFKIPYSYIKIKVMDNPKVNIEPDGSMKFEISKSDFHFNWHRKVRFDGQQFLSSGS